MDFSERQYSIEEIRQMNLKGAMYIRMSTDMQVDSPAIQEKQIREFAERYNITIVKTFTDLGASGMTVKGRDEFQALLDEVMQKRHTYSIILYLDETRWGRFVDSREAGHYRWELEKRGVICRACDKPLALTESVGDYIMTLLKDASASDYCKQLSSKVFHGQSAKILQGFRMGGVPGYGLRRMLLSDTGEHKQELQPGQRKSLQTERVILVPGPVEEQDIVRSIYRQFLRGKHFGEIANGLNVSGIMNAYGRPWSSCTVREVLTNEKYIGNNIFNRVSARLKSKPHPNPEEQWVRKVGAFAPIVDSKSFYKVQDIIRERNRKYTDDELVEFLKKLYAKKGKLSAIIIDEAAAVPNSSLYRQRFGGLVNAYKLVGFCPERDFQYIEVNRRLREMHRAVFLETVDHISAQCGRKLVFDRDTHLVEINCDLVVSIVISRCFHMSNNRRRWKIRFDTGLMPDITVAIRMDDANDKIRDYYVIPNLVISTPLLQLGEDNVGLLDTFRYPTLESLFAYSINHNLDKAVKHVKIRPENGSYQ